MADETEFLNKEFMGMKYPFKECARPELKKRGKNACRQCSVADFCKYTYKEELYDRNKTPTHLCNI